MTSIITATDAALRQGRRTKIVDDHANADADDRVRIGDQFSYRVSWILMLGRGCPSRQKTLR